MEWEFLCGLPTLFPFQYNKFLYEGPRAIFGWGHVIWGQGWVTWSHKMGYFKTSGHFWTDPPHTGIVLVIFEYKDFLFCPLLRPFYLLLNPLWLSFKAVLLIIKPCYVSRKLFCPLSYPFCASLRPSYTHNISPFCPSFRPLASTAHYYGHSAHH